MPIFYNKTKEWGKGEKGHYNPNNSIRKKCILKMSDEGLNTGPSAREAAI